MSINKYVKIPILNSSISNYETEVMAAFPNIYRLRVSFHFHKCA
jgi:hypothetical protein